MKVEFHILQSFPVTCLNRDEIGSPKTANIGGTTRARVSSQSWKRQVRAMLHEMGVPIAIRTKHLEEKLVLAISEYEVDEEQCEASAKEVASALSKDTLHFISQTEIDALAAYCKEQEFNPKNFKLKDIYKVHKKSFNPNVDGLDIALFGRMVAQAPEINIEAATAFSHAITTHKANSEIDFFTAIDDFVQAENHGSSHLGTIEFNSGTYYRYISIDLGLLYNNCMGDEYFAKSITKFMQALYLAVPIARQSSQSGACPWDYARVLVRKGQRLQLSFEKAVEPFNKSYLDASIKEMDDMLEKKEKLSGSLYGKISDYSFGRDENFSIDDLINNVINVIKA